MKKLLASAVVAAIGLTTLSSFAFYPGGGEFDAKENGEGMGGRGKAIMHFQGGEKEWRGHKWNAKWSLVGTASLAALEAKDYNAFVAAWTKDQASVTAPTSQEFAKRVEMQKAHDALELAITNGDYNAFVIARKGMPKPSFGTATNLQMPEMTMPTEEEFKRMVSQKKNHEAMQAAVKSNDYNAFLGAWNANKPAAPSKEQFDKMVEMFGKKMQNAGQKVIKKAQKIKRMLKNNN